LLSDKDLIKDFYKNLIKALNFTKNKDSNLIIGDFDTKIGEGEISGVVGKFGLGIQNYCGERLIQFYMEKKLTVMKLVLNSPKDDNTLGNLLLIQKNT